MFPCVGLGLARRRSLMRAVAGVAVGVAVLVAVAGGSLLSRAQDVAVLAPAPALDDPKAPGAIQTAVLAGGCFWGVQGVFQHVVGVESAISGYSGGDMRNPTYEDVGTGRTGHAESVEIKFDPAQITYGDILRIYFSVVHDPTQLDRQGPDFGTQYRSAIFFANDNQERIARAYVAQLTQARTFRAPIVTRIDPLKAFYRAEGYHQDFLILHPDYPYIVTYDLPKVAEFLRLFPAAWRADPARATKPRSAPM